MVQLQDNRIMENSSWAPHINRAAIDEVTRKESDYYRRSDLELGGTEDLGPWIASGEVKRYVPNLDEIEIEMIDKNSDFDDLEGKFVHFRDIGLILMGRNISRSTKPSLIVLTTPEKYYVIEPNDYDHGIKFLGDLLKNPELKLWTTNGLDEADCLHHQYNLTLHKSSARCCLGLHLHMMKILSRMPDMETLPIYPEKAFKLSRQQSNYLVSYTKLLWIWLDLEGTSELEFNPDQLAHLTRKPLNQTAINMIKKRCSLVCILSEYLRFYARRELDIMNTNVMTSLQKLPIGPTKNVMRRMMRRDERVGVVNDVYLSYLDGAFQGASLY